MPLSFSVAPFDPYGPHGASCVVPYVHVAAKERVYINNILIYKVVSKSQILREIEIIKILTILKVYRVNC